MTPQQLHALPLNERFRHFVQWLGNQPEREAYNYMDVTNCAMAQFAKQLDGADKCYHIGAGSHDVGFLFEDGKKLKIEILPATGLGLNRFALMRNRFGKAYDGFAKAAKLPKRAAWKLRAVRMFFGRVQHKHALAA